MEIKKPAIAGTVESSDCMIALRPGTNGIHIDLSSDVEMMFGKSILATAETVLQEMGVRDAEVSIVDHGALDCVIRARMQCAVCRAAEQPYDWRKEEACHV